ncbi:hypothetical protein BMI91_15775 [Thioclava sediminum]|uniref:DUF2125 domain-containing protein n=1 Tax=Thioclava sediminum TaxID=1915319 RepID=A0ABX3MTP6_9RHOB|nr:DUF2125 domain-containing protein [Thioclava sediminum]OOY22923.1 hypothetical protein BMI91_15775 [Thioclava sediminum]
MAWLKTVGSGAVVVSLLSTTASFADVTAEQVWQAWQSEYQTYGYEVMVGSQNREGDTLTVSDVKMVRNVDNMSLTLDVPELKLRDLGDGTVETVFPETMTGDMTGKPGTDTSDIAMKMTMTQTDSKVIVSGSPGDLTYDIDAPKMTMDLDQTVTAEGQDVPVKMYFSLENTKGNYHVVDGDMHSVDSKMSIGTLDLTASGADPEGSGTFNMNGQMNDLAYEGTFAMPKGIDSEKLDEALNAGANLDLGMTYASSNWTVSADGPDGKVDQKSTDQGGKLDIAMSKDGLSFGGQSNSSHIEMTTPELPFPITTDIQSADINFAMPVAKADEAQDYKAMIGLNGVTVSDNIWAMFDPNGDLPHDPATLQVDLSGKMKLSEDLFSPAAAAMDAPPMQVDTVDINNIKLSMVGADLNGKGALELKNGGPMPMPTGKIDLTLTGANALMDKLVAMGLVPQDQIMFGRMMLGLYAKPTGDDAYESQVEFQDGGEILVNGQRVQ